MASTFRVSLSRCLVPLTLVTIALFLGANVYEQRLTAAVDASAVRIAASATPSIHLLTAARDDLRSMEEAARQAIADDGRFDDRPLNQAKMRLDGDLAAYGRLPVYPEERALYLAVEQTALHFEATVARLVVAPEVPDSHLRKRAKFVEMEERADAANSALSEVIAFNASHVTRLEMDLASTRERARHLSYVLHGLAAALTLLLLGVASNAARAHERFAEDRRKMLEQRAEELELFAGRVAHDLKNPLNAIALVVQLAEEPGHIPLHDPFGRVTRNVERMQLIIDSFLEFARSAARPDLDARADLSEVVSSVVETVRGDADLVHAVLHIESMSSTWVRCAPELLASVVTNLVSNAIKYIADGPESKSRFIDVRVKKCDNGKIRFEVEDTGPGIPSGQERAVFEPFFRVGKSKQSGVGLGLATVKRVIEAYGGRVGVEPRTCGSRFWFELRAVDAKS